MRGFVFDGGVSSEPGFAVADAASGKAELVWLHFDGRNEEALAWLDAQDSIPSLVRAALIAVETRPRAEILENGALINLRGLGATPEDDPDELVSIRIWAEAGRVVSVTKRTVVALDQVASRFLAGCIRDPGDLVTAVADTITDALDPDVAALGDHVDSCERDLTATDVYRVRRQISKTRNRAIGYRRFVAPQRQALERLANAPLAWLDSDDRAHLRDAADRAARMVEELEAVRERSALIHDELTDLRSEKLEKRALGISIVAMIFLPLTFITGLLGMNVEGIPYATQRWAFWGVTGLCLLIATLISAWFIRRQWLSR
jgi:zinc transporter